jgi:hypothetical protein
MAEERVMARELLRALLALACVGTVGALAALLGA